MSNQDEAEPNEHLVARVASVLAGAQSGNIQGIICVCFLATGAVHVEVSGEQNLLVRLGALNITADCIKLLETQMAQQRAQQPANWGPGGNA